MNSRPVRVAAAQYPIDRFATLDDYRAKLARWVAEAAPRADLLLFPEYGAMELTSLLPEAVQADLAAQIVQLQSLVDKVDDIHRELAQRFNVWIVAASLPLKRRGAFRNVARVYGPAGQSGDQEKLLMTRFEREVWGIDAGDVPRVFDADFGRFAINICYDAEFPLIARAQVEAGAELILVPSCTDTLAGYYRVRIGCQARALENQCFVVQSPTVGEAAWSPAVDVNRGAAGVFSPPDYGLPDDGVIACGELDRAGWVYAELDLSASARVRREGQVFNHRDWGEQAALAPVTAHDWL